MKASELIAALEELTATHGDLPVRSKNNPDLGPVLPYDANDNNNGPITHFFIH